MVGEEDGCVWRDCKGSLSSGGRGLVSILLSKDEDENEEDEEGEGVADENDDVDDDEVEGEVANCCLLGALLSPTFPLPPLSVILPCAVGVVCSPPIMPPPSPENEAEYP